MSYLNMAEQGPHRKKHTEMCDYFVLETGLQLNPGFVYPNIEEKGIRALTRFQISQALFVAGLEL